MVDREKVKVEERTEVRAGENGRDRFTERRWAREYPRRSGRGVTGAVILIALGAAFLMANMGIIAFNWASLWSFWPVLLILFGLDLILGRRSAFGSLLLAVLSLAIVAGVIWLAGTQEAAPTSTRWMPMFRGGPVEPISSDIAVPLQQVDELDVRLGLTMMSLEIDALSDDGYAAQGDYTTDARIEPEVNYEAHNGRGQLTITQPDLHTPMRWTGTIDHRMTLGLPPGVPIALEVDADLGKVDLNLEDLDVYSLTVNASSGAVVVVLPDEGRLDEVDIDADLGKVTLEAPDGASLDIDTLHINASSGAVVVVLPAEGRLESLEIDADLGEVDLRAPDGANLDIGDLHVDASSGAVTVVLPQQGGLGDVDINADLGEVNLRAPDDSNLDIDGLYVNDSSGSVTVILPSRGTLGDVKLEASLGAIKLDVAGDPEDLSVESLVISSDSGSVDAVLPGQGDYEANIEADLGAITVRVPDGLEAHVEFDGDLGKLKMESSRFRQVEDGDIWETDNYNRGRNRVFLDIASGAGDAHIKDR
jgi:DNA-binding protein YbaB